MNLIMNGLNRLVVKRIYESKEQNKQHIIKNLKSQFDQIDDETLYKIYRKSISIRQSRIVNNGSFFEKTIENLLKENNIMHKTQVTIDKDGKIIGFGTKKKCHHIVDFVIGHNISINDDINKHVVLSCKTTCRERWTQDNWSLNNPPILYCLLTLSYDYPSSERFQESERRKIFTCEPKQKDDRIYKFDYDNLLSEINNFYINDIR